MLIQSSHRSEDDSIFILGVVLAGGNSSRMGFPKSELLFMGERLVDMAVANMRKTIITGKRVRGMVAVSGRVGGHFCIPDEVNDLGPVGGLKSVLSWAKRSRHNLSVTHLLVAPVDMPGLDANILGLLLTRGRGSMIAGFKGFELPVLVRLCRETMDSIESGSLRSIRDLLSRHRVMDLTVPQEFRWRFANVNTKHDFANFLRQARDR